MTSLREMLTTLRHERTATDDDVVDALVETFATWLEQDELRGVIYDGIVDYGPTTRNVVKHLAEEARR